MSLRLRAHFIQTDVPPGSAPSRHSPSTVSVSSFSHSGTPSFAAAAHMAGTPGTISQGCFGATRR